ncbi:unnamed protein product [Cladocopium goreaui]|uniref:Uncharacterized protein n=1 Tax=Cladocopium goreaui TaxID=2562237 RepID=A0A9P1D8V7_9DINO|nr:unnamed protein product [Cladocopium goreaui]
MSKGGVSRLQPPSRPSSAWQRPSSAPAGPRTNATNGVSVSWRGRRYRVRQTGDRSQLSQTSLDSMAGMASFSIYTDHGLSDDEDHQDHPPGAIRAEGAEGTEDAPPPEADAASTEMAVEAESEDSSISTGDAAAEVDAAAEAAKMWSGKATLGILQVTVAERPLYAELKMGGEAQSTSCVTGRWPSLAEKLTFELKDIRVEENLTLCFWTSVGEWRSRPRCVAHGKTTLNFDEKERQVKVTLDVHQNGQLLRGLAVLHLEVSGCTSETDIDHSDENCSRNLLLSRRFKGRRFRGIKERPVGPMDRVMDVNARCWNYLEHRSSFLKVRRQECHQRIRKAQALRAGPAANQGLRGCKKGTRVGHGQSCWLKISLKQTCQISS